jgi:hypothetical protein
MVSPDTIATYLDFGEAFGEKIPVLIVWVFKSRLFNLRLRPSETVCVYRFNAVAIFAGHFITTNNPIVSFTGTLFAFPSVGRDEFFIAGDLH